MGFATFLTYIISISAFTLNVLTYSLTRARTRNGKAIDATVKSDGDPRFPLEKVIDAVTQWKPRYQRAKADLFDHQLDILLKAAVTAKKIVETVFPTADAQTKAEQIKKTFLVLSEQRLGKDIVKKLEQALLEKPDILEQIAEKTKVTE